MTATHQQFANLAATYCDAIEGGLSGGSSERAGALARLLAQLYAAAAALPEAWDDRYEEMEEARSSISYWPCGTGELASTATGAITSSMR